MIKLEFTPELFDAIYEGVVVGSACTSPNDRGWNKLENEATLIGKLWSISELAKCGKKFPTGDLARELVDKRIVEFTPEEFVLIMKYFRNAPWSVVRSIAVLEIWKLLVEKAEGSV